MSWEDVLAEMRKWLEECQAALASHSGYPPPYIPPSPDTLGKLPPELADDAAHLLSAIRTMEKRVIERRGAVVETLAALPQQDDPLPLYLDEHA